VSDLHLASRAWTTNTSLLRAGLRLNALFSISTGALAVAYTSRLEALRNLPALALTLLGLVLCVCAAGLLALAVIQSVASPWAVGATALDFLWVIGSVALVGLREVPIPGLVLAIAPWCSRERSCRCSVSVGPYKGSRALRGRWRVRRTIRGPHPLHLLPARGAWTELYPALIFALDGNRLVGAILGRWAKELEQTGTGVRFHSRPRNAVSRHGCKGKRAGLVRVVLVAPPRLSM
jgi:hypothetical protein